ncbi:porin family protein [Adhaeribacter aquaticus]|uniref:porin family protein n=1 Tax=Adhaeribacter aquaticus TaxID=299567 RepID=UPI00040E6B2E|nr:porin family protein [Adhaeribacter aquaticus]
MKKLGFLLLNLFSISVFTIHLASAQKVEFGLKGGLNRTSINDEQMVQDSEAKPRMGFHIGGLAHIHLNDTWAVQPEVMYSKEGAEYTSPIYTGKTDLNYINVPVLLQYMVGTGLRIQTGPQVGYLTSAKYEQTNNVETKKNDIQNGNAAWVFGLGYLTKSGFGIDGRFNLGLSDIYKDGVYPGKAARTRAGQLGIFYQFK